MNKVKFCLVGAGSIGRRHLRLLQERDDVEMVVVEPFDAGWERVAQECVERGNAVPKRYLSLDEVLAAEKLDACLIATPHGMHAPQAIQALKAGVNVFCEKPMSDSMEECVAMLRAAQESGKIFSVGFMFHFDPFIQKVKEILNSGKIGKIVHYASRFCTYNTLLCSVTRHQAHTPYSLVMDCIHDTDLLCYLTGATPDYAYSNVIEAGSQELHSTPNVIDTLFRWKSGELAANIHMDYVEHPQVHSLEIVGDKGYIQGNFMEPSVTVGDRESGKVEHFAMTRDFDDVYRAEWDRFVRAVRGEVEPENPANTAIYSTLLMQAQKESGASGKEVDIHEIAARDGFTY